MSIEPTDEYYTEEGYTEDEPQVYEGNVYQGQPIPVVSVDVRWAPEFGGVMTWALPVQGVGQPLLILNRRIRRSKGKIQINFPAAGTVILSSNLAQIANNQGYIVTVPVAGLYTFHDWENQQPLYAIASIAGVTALVLDESYAER